MSQLHTVAVTSMISTVILLSLCSHCLYLCMELCKSTGDDRGPDTALTLGWNSLYGLDQTAANGWIFSGTITSALSYMTGHALVVVKLIWLAIKT